ncbi:MAG: hypothetical protein ACYTKD_29290, partial [Planctomycetota bacterium]
MKVGEEKLLAVEPPVNRFPEFVDRIVARMAVALPDPTKRKIATRLARAGLHISASAVYDRMKSPPEPDSDAAADEEPPVPEKPESSRTVAAHYPNHVWNMDLTAVRIRGGSWTPLSPSATSFVQRLTVFGSTRARSAVSSSVQPFRALSSRIR